MAVTGTAGALLKWRRFERKLAVTWSTDIKAEAFQLAMICADNFV